MTEWLSCTHTHTHTHTHTFSWALAPKQTTPVLFLYVPYCCQLPCSIKTLWDTETALGIHNVKQFVFFLKTDHSRIIQKNPNIWFKPLPLSKSLIRGSTLKQQWMLTILCMHAKLLQSSLTLHDAVDQTLAIFKEEVGRIWVVVV